MQYLILVIFMYYEYTNKFSEVVNASMSQFLL